VDIVLNRSGGSVRDQLVAQLEMKILEGSFAHGQRLPSVRALARRLKVHHNTVSAAYQELEAMGHVELQRGSGVFVRRAGPTALPEARGLDEMIRLALLTAFQKGFTGKDVRAAVERWLAAVPPERALVVDPSAEMGELLAHEVRNGVGLPVTSCSVEELQQDPGRASSALLVVLPYHVETVRRIVPGAAVEVVTLELSAEDRQAILSAAAGSIVLVVSHSPTVLPFAATLLRSLRGDEVLPETRLLSDITAWKRLVRVADLVLADALSAQSVSRSKPRRLREVRVIPPKALDRLREALTVVAPAVVHPPARAAAKRKSGR
jgi:DNA-binding transcriptional regulator YhcF (GntR family)